eukprot:COSAG02_NODE_64400_length_260_cov_1.285714_1_plen_38_part_01
MPSGLSPVLPLGLGGDGEFVTRAEVAFGCALVVGSPVP